tara:strand:+ start:744 stop:896 length:153 start_codon:yes stop_codon:yes gene_type:complete
MDKIENMSIPLGLQTITKEKGLIINQKGSGKKNLKIVNRPISIMPKNLLK